ncbi:MAG: SDR family oxidoreductase [Caulobacteraceae bacterium]
MTSYSIAITGAGSGIGRGAALGLARAGHKVLATVQFAEQAAELNGLSEDNLSAVKIDLLSAEDRQALAAREIDVLINNAAVSETGPIAEQPLELLRRVFETNVFATLALTQAVAREMVKRGRGRIIFVSSMAGLMAIPYVGAYCASKHALEAIAGCMQAELAPHGVEVVTFQPGPYNTGFNDQMWATQKKWFNPETNFTRASDMAGTAAILDQQLDPEEAIAALVRLAPAAQPRFRNVVPLAIENMIKGVEQEAWSRRL